VVLDLGRYTEPALAILVALADGPRHGYGIMEEAEARWGVRLGPGTLYAALARLERDGLISALPPQERRRPYRLTRKGRNELQAQLDGLRRMAASGLRSLRAARGTA